MSDLAEGLRTALGRLVTLDVPASPGTARAALPGAAASAPGPLDAEGADEERLRKLSDLVTAAAPEESGRAAYATHAYFTEIDRPIRPSTREAMRPGMTLSETRSPDYAAHASDGTESGPTTRTTAGETARTRFSWEDTAPEEIGSAPPRRFSWEPPAATAPAARFSWETQPTTGVGRKDGRYSRQEPAPALVPRGWIPAGPLTRPIEIELPEMAAGEEPKSDAAANELRAQQLALRVQVCCDAYRMLGELGTSEDTLRTAGRALTTLDELLDPDAKVGPGGSEGALGNPEPFVERLPPDALVRLDRLLAELEDALLELDDRITPGLFRERVEQKRRSRTMLARYARLLASRRFNAGERRDRFEWLATRLLTIRKSPSERVMLPREEARVVLKHLVGGFPPRAPEQERADAIENLKESLAKLDDVRTPEELFDTGIFLDAHGYKVSMRDHLLSPDFLYLSVAISAKIENMLETWVAYLERAEPSRAVESSSARARVYKLLADQEAEVDRIFGVRRVTDEELAAAARQPERPKSKKAEEKGKRRFELPAFALDRALATLGILALLIAASLGSVMVSTGKVGKEEIVALQLEELNALSPLLKRGYLVGTGEDRRFLGEIRAPQWSKLKNPERWEVAEGFAGALAAQGVHEAEVKRGQSPVLVIRKGKVTQAVE